MVPLVYDIKVEISEVKVDAYYYSFGYKVYVNGDLRKEGNYESDHAWHDDIPGFRKLLKSGEAMKIVLKEIRW